MAYRRLTFTQVCALQPGDELTEAEGAFLATIQVTSVPVISRIAPERRVTFNGLWVQENREANYELIENGYINGPRLYVEQPIEPPPASGPRAPASARPGLGELDIPSHLDAVFLLGELVASLNKSGVLLQPGFKSDVLLSPRTGDWKFMDTINFAVDAFTPAEAAGQFADFTGEPLQALVAGYARKAYQVLTPIFPELPQRVLTELLPEPIPTVPQPRPQLFDLGAVLQAYGATLHLAGAKPQLVFAAPAPPAVPPTDEELLLASTVVFTALLNLSEWLAQVAACEPAREVAHILGGLARGELFDPAWGGLLPKLFGAYRPQQRLRAWLLAKLEERGNELLMLFSHLYRQEGFLAEVYEQSSAFRQLRPVLDLLPLDNAGQQLARRRVLASVMDGLDYLALAADEQGYTHTSLTFAQASVMALQALPTLPKPAEAEAWLARVQAQELRYSWCQLTPAQPLILDVVWQYAGYAGSVRLAMQPFCEVAAGWYEQGKVINQLWTVAWQSLHRLRKAVQLGYAQSQQGPLPTNLTDVGLALHNLLSHYQKALRDLTDMLVRTTHSPSTVTLWAGLSNPDGDNVIKHLAQEQKLLVAVYKSLVAHGYGEQTLQRYGELAGLLE